MPTSNEIVKAVAEDPGLLQRGLLWAFGVIGALASLLFGMAIKNHREEITNIKGGITYLGDRFHTLESRVDVIERDYTRNDRFDAAVNRLESKIDRNHEAIMAVLLRRREDRIESKG